MPRSIILSLRNNLEANFSRIERLFGTALGLRPSSRYSWRPISWKQADEIVELAFLKCFIIWETFQEEIFIHYLLGKSPPNGEKIVRYFFPENREHAKKLYTDPRGFSDWTTPDTVIERAEVVFENGGLLKRALSPRIVELKEIKKIRNAIAHWSGPAKSQFENIVRSRIGYYPREMSPGRFLVSRIGGGVRTYFKFYLEILKDTIGDIAPY